MASITFGNACTVVFGQVRKEEVTAGPVAANLNEGTRVVVVPTAAQMATPTPSVSIKIINRWSNKAVSSYERQVEDVFANFFAKKERSDELLTRYYGKVVRKGNRLMVKRVPLHVARVLEKQRLQDIEDEKAFLQYCDAGVHVAGSVKFTDTRSRGQTVSFRTEHYKPTGKIVQKKKAQKQRANADVDHLTDEVMKICSADCKQVEFISMGKRRLTAKFKMFGKSVIPCIQLAHEKGRRLRRELDPRIHEQVIAHLVKGRKVRELIKDDMVTYGWSGAILNKKLFKRTPFRWDEVVIRGRLYGKLVDARSKLSEYSKDKIHQYSSFEAQFWKGWKNKFDTLHPHNKDHICEPTINNEKCGEIVATVFQAIHPVIKVSCSTCRERLTKASNEELNEYIATNLACHKATFDDMRQQHATVNTVLNKIEQTSLANPNLKDSMEIVRLLQNLNQTQARQLMKVNNTLLKGNVATSEEFSDATTQLLEVTRWYAKHLSLVDEGSISSFRNKATSKSLINPSLLCDNQLDRNGNFVWGERGRHSKRFFENFFEEVVPGGGYKKYQIRNSPNCTRKLAIGNLIVPMSLERARNALIGESVERLPVTEACVSRVNGAFMHVASCVTSDNGSAHFSPLYSPTKRHLVVGTTGDSKYIDLPATESDKMYVAKEGYCYINIFLAMLVNVNEDSAKDFTKMIRDTIVPMLGTWPSMMDVATACYILTVFHPETKSAELPRILVDHTNKTMHVIDSFGSISTGYHILKAGTVSQLIHFASNELVSEMKHYVVGGEASHARRMRMEKALIQGIFKPKQLVYLIEEDPYILMMSLVSPTLLINLFNVGGLEVAMKHWIKKEMNIGLIFSMLSSLAQKVSRADLVNEQITMIDANAAQFIETLAGIDVENPMRNELVSALTMMLARSDVDSTLNKTGFTGFSETLLEMREKIIGDELSKVWSELSWWEKFSSIIFSRRARKHIMAPLPNTKLHAIDDRYAISCTWLRGKIKARFNGAKSATLEMYKKVTNTLKRNTVDSILYICRKCYSDIFYFMNVMLISSMILSVIYTMHKMVIESRAHKQAMVIMKMREDELVVKQMYDQYCKLANETPTKEEFFQYVCKMNKELGERIAPEFEEGSLVAYQAKTETELGLEKVVAYLALIAMIFDGERSDAVFRALSKLKTVFGTLGETVRYQSLDEIESVADEKKMTIDFELEGSEASSSTVMSAKFSDWWYKQLETNRVVPHYRIGGEFVEFTRKTAAEVVNNMRASNASEFLVRGAVGSGKSTGLPHLLAQKGRVLLLEPTRPLAENVCKQLRQAPFQQNPTLRMRGLTTFGSSNIVIMTSGFALHYYANNPTKLQEYDFVMIDESHTMDASAMAFYCLVREYNFQGKIMKVSATPPGKECEFKTQFDVALLIEEDLSFQQFAQSQGQGGNADMTKHGDNILVYVASYNDVDQLAELLIRGNHFVTKVDGRTMKMGSTEIVSKGTASKKHYIIATNIIENGVTLDVDVVVDFGQKVVAELDGDSRCMRYRKVAVSYGERIQRLGRVGRVKKGTALRIGHTEHGISEIPASISTEAAFLCFAYGLPVITHNVTVSILANCTVQQARTMMLFELSPFFLADLVKYNGSMHPEVHKLLKPYKLRDSEIELCKLAIPNSSIGRWLSVHEYAKLGIKIHAEDSVRIPFAGRGIPDKLYSELWHTIQEHKHEAGFGRLTSASASTIAYTLSTDPEAIPRTIALLDNLIAEEMQKKAHFEALNSTLCSQRFTLKNIVDTVRQRYMKDHSKHNIEVLQSARSQILEFNSATHDFKKVASLLGYGFLDTVQYQSKNELSKRLGLKGRWNKSLVTNDLLVCGMVLFGGVWMVWEYAKSAMNEPVRYQGKRQNQKLKFRDARDRKVGREVYGDDGTIEHFFGEAYTKKGKSKGNHTVKGMGRKTRRFIHMYGFDPTEYSFVRFVDPLTGYAIDENITCDISLVQDEVAEVRRQFINEDEISAQSIAENPGIIAYYMSRNADKALKVDLTPHNPLAVGKGGSSIAGFPEREYELRQTGKPLEVKKSEVPPVSTDVVATEGKSMCRGLRNYNPIATSICKLVNESDGHSETIHGIGFGPVIITNSHLFRRNNGTLQIQTHHGVFRVKNSTQLQVSHMAKKDMIIIKMPCDVPPFPSKLRFRQPEQGEKAVLVGSLFQQKSITSSVSESTMVMPVNDSGYWRHWVSTKDGDCGLPLVSTVDGMILGLHGLTSTKSDRNYFVPFDEQFERDILANLEKLDWKRHWLHSSDLIAWGGMSLKENHPHDCFRTSKLVTDLLGLTKDSVEYQSGQDKWVLAGLENNLKAVAQSESQLVTKHVVKGQCMYFQEYLATHPTAEKFFKPLMGAYQPSKLNKEAFTKDLYKYQNEIIVGEVDKDAFDNAIEAVIYLLDDLGFGECAYVTDEEAILDSLNMKAAVGALYKGKKKEYFESLSEPEKHHIVQASCERLFYGEMGVWNGSLKAELRPKEKVALNKTRTFTAAPIDTLLGGKCCVDDFNNRFYSLNIEGPWTVGMTKFYGGWDKLMRKLPDGWRYCHADGSQFDSSLTPFLLNAVLAVRLMFMEDWWVGEQMLRNFYTEIIYTPILTPDGTIVKKFKGNNSGQPSTVVDNTLMVLIAMFYGMKKLNWTDEQIKERIVFFANGDDLIIAVQPEHEGILDTLQRSLGELGLKYDFSERCDDRQELWFMSHQGHLVDGMYIPKLEQERIVSILEWDRSTVIEHRAEAICAAMIEAWGYPELLKQIRLFYAWILDHDMFKSLVAEGKLPYIAETALRKLYTDADATDVELEEYMLRFMELDGDEEHSDEVRYQSGENKSKVEIDAAAAKLKEKEKEKHKKTEEGTSEGTNQTKEPDVDTGSQGIVNVPKLAKITKKMRMPMVGGQVILHIPHLLDYKPEQVDLSNTRSSQQQFTAWYNGLKEAYEITDDTSMSVLMNGLMVWCIENGTSPNINGNWTMMDGHEQNEYPLKPVIENAKPTFRQIMHHFSDAAEAYIEMRNAEKPYMPRYGLQRNLRDFSYARIAFDFYEITSRTSAKAREIHMQMKAAALNNVTIKTFGLDGNVGTQDEDTERHTANDVNRNMHSLLGMRQM
uniref:Genome polyprotein n=2 Tax=Peanut mottle virus TaxID=33763 RepID=A0A2D1CLH5_9POTV|nr:polyprotein [Peanut mottle virus]